MAGWLVRLMAEMALVMSLAACGGTAPPPVIAPPAVSSDPAAACLSGLTSKHVIYDRVKDWGSPEGCGITGAVRVKKSAFELNSPALMTCSMASTLWDFETKVVQPAAQSILHQRVRKLLHMGSYNCRSERSEHAERLSQHSFGKAIDVSGFELEDGTKLTVLHDWHGEGPKAEFLHAVAKGACTTFNVVMTPNSNALHRDHLHLDIGPYKHCG